MVGRGAGYSRDRSGDHSVEHLKTFAGILQADIYAGFNRLYVAGRSPGPVIGGACWAHSRRKFYELADIAASRRRGKTAPQISPLALEAVQRIDVLFDIERGINGKSAGERLAMRQELSTPVLADLNNWMQAERAKLSRHSSVAKAMDYNREHTHRRRARTGLEGHRAVVHLVGAWARRVWPLGPDPRQLSAGAVPEDCLVIGWRTGLPPVVREQLSNDFFDIPLQAQHGSGG